MEKKYSQLIIPFYIFSAFLITCTVIRFCNYFLNFFAFKDLSFLEVLYAFVLGLWFDTSILAFILLPFLLFFPLCIRYPKVLVFIKTLLSLTYLVILLFLSGDILYFNFISKHLTDELLYLISEFNFILTYAVSLKGILFVLFSGISFILFFKWLSFLEKKRKTTEINSFYKSIALVLVLAAASFFCIRGTLERKSITIAHAYKWTSSLPQAELTLNGLFTSYQYLRKQSSTNNLNTSLINNSMDVEEGIEVLKSKLLAKNEITPDKNFPLMRYLDLKKHKSFISDNEKVNVVVLALESWNINYIDSLSNSQYNATPFFNELVANSLVFDQFYSTGLISIYSITSILSSIPTIPGYRMDHNNADFLTLQRPFNIFKQNNYKTIFAQTSYCESLHLCLIASTLGFEETYGMADYPRLYDYDVSKGNYGYDFDMLSFAGDHLIKIKKPFFFFGFTGSTHGPYIGQVKGFEKYSSATEEGQYLNALSYADHSLKVFFEKMKEGKLYENTIFILLADHTTQIDKQKVRTLKDNYRIPFIIHAPKYIKPGVNHTIGSQLDIFPTLIDFLGFSQNYSSFGKSLFQKDEETSYAYIIEGAYIGLITKNGMIKHNGEKILAIEKSNEKYDEGEAVTTLFAIEKSVNSLLKKKLWYKN